MKSFCVVISLILISTLPAYAGKWATGTTAPTTCIVGDSWTDTNGTADNRFYTCTATNTWTLNGNQTAIDTKANKTGTVMQWSEWANGASFTTSSPPVAYNGALYKCTTPYTKISGETPDTQTEYFAEVTGSGGGIAHATSDGAYYASRNGVWANLANIFLTPTGSAANLTGFPSSLATDTEVTSAVSGKANSSAFASAAAFEAAFGWVPGSGSISLSTEQDWTVVQNFNGGLTADGLEITISALSDIKFGTGNWLDDTKGNGDTNYLWSADKIFDQLALKAASDHTHTGTYEPADSAIIKVSEIDSLAKFEALLGWSPGSGGSFAFDTFPTYEDSAHSSGIAVSGTTLAIYSTVANKWLTVGLTDSLNPTPVTYAATLTIADASATGDTFTLNSVAYDVGDSPVSVTNLPTDTEQITYTGSNTAACTGDVTGMGPWTINASPATIGCTITLASSGITDDFNREDGGLGASWATISSLTAPVIVSQAVKPGTDGYLAGAFRTSPTYTSNQSSIIKITESDGGSYGPVVRSSLTQYGYHMTHTWEGWIILKAYDNQLVATSGAAATDGSYLKLTAVGTTPTVITGYVCSTPTTCTQVVTYSDATSPHVGGSPGFRAYNTATIIDDFYGASL